MAAFYPTEAAVVGCVYALLVGKFVYRELILKIFTRLSGVGHGKWRYHLYDWSFLAFASYLTMAQVPATVASWFFSISNNPYVILILINIFLLFVGCL